ncbi:hypothetical protein LPJ61_000786 [Coemansia biformis]|uniref:Zn(2)-C6 fungal-type domain-containing protein n=1 Tax=Coemansia biformis TaxID=1286918 RepID=A0A9W8CYR2_9FUNG|nr:hypothetical protein LPJ61_000786 [Coemansia biformis]
MDNNGGSTSGADGRRPADSAPLGADSARDPGSPSQGTFLFPLSDQASLFNFHAPADLGVGSFRVGSGDPVLSASLFGTMPENSPQERPAGPLLAFETDLAAVEGSGTFAGPPLGGAADGARDDTARARLLSSVLYGMGLGGIQPLDGLYNGSMVLPPEAERKECASAAAGSTGLKQMAATAGALGPLSLFSGLTYPGMSFPLLSPISPFGSGQGAEQADAASATTATMQLGAAPPRIDQACKMCRRRKVRCDGKRPACTFCQTKRFVCTYEPVALGNRKRGRRTKGSDAGSVGLGGVGAHHMFTARSDADNGLERYGKIRRLSELPGGAGASPESSDAESTGASSSEEGPASGYLDALSNRQIALLGGVGANAATHAAADSQALAGPKNPASPGAGAASSDTQAGQGSANRDVSADERQVRRYFEYYHTQHPVLHRHSFEASMRDGTVNKALLHAVLAIAARYGPPPSPDEVEEEVARERGDGAADVDAGEEGDEEAGAAPTRARRRLRPCEFGRRHAELACAMLPAAMQAPSIEVVQTLYLLSEHQFGVGDWLAGSTYWGTAVRMFNQLQLHMTDEAFQFPAYTSHLGLHESAISPLTCRQSPAHYAGEMRKPTLNNESWIRRELVRRMRWVLFESERMHSLAGGSPPLVTLEAGWVHMPCSDAIWEMAAPRRAAESERLLLHMGRYYVDTGGSLRIDMAPGAGPAAGAPPAAPHGPAELPAPNRVASMLVSVRRRKNRIHLNAHTAIVIGQMTRARLALYRLFFPCRWPSQLMAADLPGAPPEQADLGGGGGAAGPVVLSWEERFRRMRATVADIETKLAQWRVYLELMFPLREHEEGSGRSDSENCAIRRERAEYANYRFLLAALLIQNRATVLQLQACLARRERKIRSAELEPDMGEAARQTLANHVVPNQPGEQAMQALRAYAQECWDVIVRQACEIEDLLESHWQVRPHANASLRVLVRPDWHAPNAIKAKINAEANLRRHPVDASTGQRDASGQADVFFSHETPPHPLLVVNRRLVDAVVRSANAAQGQSGAELALAASMNSNIHIETNANARSSERSGGPGVGAKTTRGLRVASASGSAGRCRRSTSGAFCSRISLTDAGEVDFESVDEADEGAEAAKAADPFRRQLTGTSYYLFLAAKTLIMYIHQAKMSAYLLARRSPDAKPAVGGGSGSGGGDGEGGDAILPSSSVSVENGADSTRAQQMLAPDFIEDLSPAPQLRTLADIRRMQDRLEVVMTALRTSQKYWTSVDYFALCARKLRNMMDYGPWRAEDPVSSDISAGLANEAWPPAAAAADPATSPMFGKH